jgi:hypothetical protein
LWLIVGEVIQAEASLEDILRCVISVLIALQRDPVVSLFFDRKLH